MTSERAVNRGPAAAAENRAALIDAARAVFAEQGYEASMKLVARRAGVGQASLYRHFPTREAFAVAVFEDDIAVLEQRAADPDADLEQVMTFIIDSLVRSAGFVAMLDPSSPDPLRADIALRFSSLIAHKLADERQRGAIRADVTTREIFLAVGMVAAILATTAPPTRQVVADECWQLLLRGLRAPRPTSPRP